MEKNRCLSVVKALEKLCFFDYFPDEFLVMLILFSILQRCFYLFIVDEVIGNHGILVVHIISFRVRESFPSAVSSRNDAMIAFQMSLCESYL